MTRMLAAGLTVTNDPGQIDLHEIAAVFAGDFESGDSSAWSATTP